MILFKKLAFAPLFLITFAVLLYQLIPLLKSYDLIFSPNVDTLTQLIIVSFLFTASAFLFVIFVTLAQNWKIALPVGVIAAAETLVFLDLSSALIFIVGILASISLIVVILDSTLGSYLNFQPGKVLGPSVKLLSMLLILSFCVVYFFAVTKIITQNGFEIPDSLIDTALKMSPATSTQLPDIPPEQIELLRQNPQALKQSGLDPKMLDSLSLPANELLKQEVKNQLQSLIKPYQNFVPLILTVLLFFMLQFFTSIINIFISPLLALLFLILEKTGYTRYEIEKREVKKLVV